MSKASKIKKNDLKRKRTEDHRLWLPSIQAGKEAAFNAMLQDSRIDVNYQNKHGNTALHMVFEYG